MCVCLCVDTEEDASDLSQDEDLQKKAKAELTDLQFKFEVKEVLLLKSTLSLLCLLVLCLVVSVVGVVFYVCQLTPCSVLHLMD